MQITGNKLKLSHEIPFFKWVNMIFENAACCDDELNFKQFFVSILLNVITFINTTYRRQIKEIKTFT